MSAAGFNAAFVAALGDEAEEEALAVIWDQVSRALPRRTDLGALAYTERPWVGPSADDGTRPRYERVMHEIIEFCGKPPLGRLGGYRERAKKGALTE